MTAPTAAELVARFGLAAHPEGGWYRETYRGEAQVDTPRGSRSCATAIYYLLQAGERSALHRIHSDETWCFHAGDPLAIHVFTDGHHVCRLGLDADCEPQVVVPAGAWFGAVPTGNFTLCSCLCRQTLRFNF